MRRIGLVFLVVVVLAVVFLGGWYWFAWRWPQGELIVSYEIAPVFVERPELALDERAVIRVLTNQDYDGSVRREVDVSLDVPFLRLEGATRIDIDGLLAFELDVTALQPAVRRRLRGHMAPEGGTAREFDLPIHVSMPSLYREEPANFLEMTESPPEYIYGSEITLWNRPLNSDRVVVTGHAASSVCRSVSAAIMRLALHSDREDPEFFIGAGLAVLRPNLTRATLLEHLDRFREEHPATWGALRTALTGGNPERKLQVEATRDRESGLGQLFVDRELRSLRGLLETLSREAGGPADVPAGEGLQRYLALSGRKPAALSVEDLDLVASLLKNPAEALRYEEHAHRQAYSALGEHIQALTEEQRKQVLAATNKLQDVLTLLNEVDTDLREVEDDTGLLKTAPPHHATVDGDTQARFLTDLAAHVRGSPEGTVFATELAGGHRGVVLAPYFTLEGEALEFSLDKSDLLLEGHDEVASFLESSFQKEIAASARRTATRWEQSAETVRETLEDLRRSSGVGSPNADRLRAWLSRSKKYRMRTVDDRGRPTGEVQEVWQDNLKYYLGRVGFAASAQRSAHAFAALATGMEGGEADARLSRVVEQCCIDSFLRGWKLSFVDDSLEQQFETWMKGTRQAVWERLFIQAAGAGVDARALIREGTVFLVASDGARVLIRPRCVISLQTAAIVRDAENGLFVYEIPWNDRDLSYYEQGDWEAVHVPNDSLQHGNPESFQKAARTAMEHILSEAAALESAESGEYETRREELMERLRAAFVIEPQHAAQQLAGSLLAFWKPRKSDAAGDRDFRLLLGWGKDETSAKEALNRMVEGSWSFPDTYMYFVIDSRKEGTEPPAGFEDRARKLDAGFVESVLKAGTLDRESKRLAAARTTHFLDAFRQSIGLLRGLLEQSESEECSARSLASLLSSTDVKLRDLLEKIDGKESPAEGPFTQMQGLSKAIGVRPDPDSLDRYLWKKEVEEIVQGVARIFINRLESNFSRNPTREGLEHLVELTWVTGKFRQAFRILQGGVMAHLRMTEDRDATRRFSALVRVAGGVEEYVLKGLVYTNRSLVGESLFSREITDFVLKPVNPTQIPRRLDFGTLAGQGKGTGNAIADVYRKAVGGQADDVIGFRIGDLTVRDVKQSFTDARILVVEGPDGRSVMKVRPQTARARGDARAAGEIGDFLRRKGFDTPAPLPAGKQGLTFEESGIVVTRERFVRGRTLEEVRSSAPGGRLPAELENAYIDTSLELAHKAVDLPDTLSARRGIRTPGEMRIHLKRRNQLAEAHSRIFDQADAHKEILRTGDGPELREFHKVFGEFVEGAWPAKYGRMEALGFIHDAHLGNYMQRAGAKKLTVIDVEGDYVGNVGHLIGMMSRSLRASDAGYAAFRTRVHDLVSRFEKVTGKKLSAAGKRDLFKSMAFPPYQIISSDSRQFFGKLRKQLGVPDTGDLEQLGKALGKPEARTKLDALLRDEVALKKYREELRQLDFSIRLLEEVEVDPKVIEHIRRLRDLITLAGKTGYRIAAISSPEDVRGLAERSAGRRAPAA